jgi:serine/threonine protein phosphatase 1
VSGRILALGDVHGCDMALEALLKIVAPTPHDTLVFLGDLVDRGPGSREVIEQVLKLREICRCVFILGNHEEMMLDALAGGAWREGWLRYGGTATLFSYNGDARTIPSAHLDFLKSGVDYWETPSDIFVHANLKPGTPLAQQPAEWLRWRHLDGGEPVFSTGQRVICGHTPQKNGLPLARPGWVCLDTYASGSGWLTCLDVGPDEIVQANQDCKTRSFYLGQTPEASKAGGDPE